MPPNSITGLYFAKIEFAFRDASNCVQNKIYLYFTSILNPLSEMLSKMGSPWNLSKKFTIDF